MLVSRSCGEGKLVGDAALYAHACEAQERDHSDESSSYSACDRGRAPAVDAHTLKRWLDQGHDDNGRPVVTLDTRNGFEVAHGTFENAIEWDLGKIQRISAAAVQAHRDELEGKTIVSFCTGGHPCEKAAIYMRELGLEHTFQLDGGILKYFELWGPHTTRELAFVFDQRRTLDPSSPRKFRKMASLRVAPLERLDPIHHGRHE